MYKNLVLRSRPVNGDNSGSAALEIASDLVYAYQHNPIIQARKMADPKHLALLLKQGVEVWNKWRLVNPGIKVGLCEADLHKAFLRGADLRERIFTEHTFTRRTLVGQSSTRRASSG